MIIDRAVFISTSKGDFISSSTGRWNSLFFLSFDNFPQNVHTLVTENLILIYSKKGKEVQKAINNLIS